MTTLVANQRNPLRLDPTRTTSLQKAFLNDLKRRFAALRQAVRKLVYEEDAFGLKPRPNPLAMLEAPVKRRSLVLRKDSNGKIISSPIIINARWEFQSNPEKLRAYQEWFKQQADRGLLEIEPGAADPLEPWTVKHVGSAYRRGQVRAYTDTRRESMARGLDFYEGSRQEFLDSAFLGKVRIEQIEMLGLRSFEKLKDVTLAMSGEMSRILSAGLAHGLGADQLARQMTDSISQIERVRANRIVRTEMIHAYAEGQLDSFEALGVEEVGVMAEWSTAGDDLVCPLCLPLDGIVMKVSESRGIIPRHPNCRCAFIPALPSVSGKATGPKTSKQSIEDAIEQSVRMERGRKAYEVSKEEAFRRTKWIGADRNIAKIRTPGEPRKSNA